MNRLTYLIGLLLCFTFATQAQITLSQDPAIAAMVARDKVINKSNPQVKAWCVQLISSDDREVVMAKRAAFQELYPGIRADWDFESPYYKLRAGAFRNKLDAYELLHTVRPAYPDAYLVQSNRARLRDLL